MAEEERKLMPHEAVIGLMKEAQKDFREMIGELKKFNENMEAAMLYMSEAIEEKKEEVEEEEKDEVSDSE